MKTTLSNLEIRLYVGTYSKYNSGSLFGAYLNLSDYSDLEEFYRACKVLHKDEEDPEFMFQDIEGPAEIRNLIGESWISESVFELLECENPEIILGVMDYMGFEEVSEAVEFYDDNYQGKYSNDIDFVQTLLEETGEIPANLPHYIHIDWESTARDVMYDYIEIDGHYFRNC